MVKVQKFKLIISKEQSERLVEVSSAYRDACNFVSQWVFDHGVLLDFLKIQKQLYHEVREKFRLNSQLTLSVFKTVVARYKTVREQLFQNPAKYKVGGKIVDGKKKGVYKIVPRTLEWLWHPLHFKALQCDQVRNRNYRISGHQSVALTTMHGVVKCSFYATPYFHDLLNAGWKMGTAKIFYQRKNWYLLVPMSSPEKEVPLSPQKVDTIVGIDRGLRFLVATADSKGNTSFLQGKSVTHKRHQFEKKRRVLQIHNTKSSRRRIRLMEKRENRWMSDINHQISKALVDRYGSRTLFVLEDLTGVSFDEENLNRSKKQKKDLTSWAFYQLEQFLSYKAQGVGSMVLKVPAHYTSQRCPKCGKILKSNRNHTKHEYSCSCGFRSNDDRVGALNLLYLGTRWMHGDENPRIVKPTVRKSKRKRKKKSAKDFSCNHNQLLLFENIAV